MLTIDNKFDFGDTVYLETDINQYPRKVIAMEIFAEGEVLYKLMAGTSASYHYHFEISKEKDTALKIEY